MSDEPDTSDIPEAGPEWFEKAKLKMPTGGVVDHVLREKKLIPDRYLGDGVYASYDGFCVVLDLRAQDSTTKIYLEPAVLEALFAFRRDLLERARKMVEEAVCIDCDGNGVYPSGQKCQSCGGSGRVLAEDRAEDPTRG